MPTSAGNHHPFDVIAGYTGTYADGFADVKNVPNADRDGRNKDIVGYPPNRN
jgi:hypothetical protein